MRIRRHFAQVLVLAVLLILAATLYKPGPLDQFSRALTRKTLESRSGVNRNFPRETKDKEQRHGSLTNTSAGLKNTPVEKPKDRQKRKLPWEAKDKVQRHDSVTNTSVEPKNPPVKKPKDGLKRNLPDEVNVEDGRKHGSVTNTSAGPKNSTVEKPKHGKKRKKHPYYKWVPDEAAAEEKFLADQKAVQSVPTEAPGWVYNKTAADLFRKEMINGSHIQNGNFLTTQENAPLNFAIKRYEKTTTIMNVSKEVLHRFPKISPFKAKAAKRYKTCSIVGNGGILKASGCGQEIDASEFVFRCNFAPMGDEYVNDIGKKTNLITLNPGMIEYQYNSFENETKSENVASLVRDLSVYGDSYLWIPAFFFQQYVDLTFAAHQALREIGHKKNEVIIPHPDFIKSAQAYWSKNGLGTKRATTGLYVVSAATQICEEVHLYGFWPFHADRNNRRLTEHYFDNALPTRAHSVPDEFRQLLHLHNTGVLHLTTSACARLHLQLESLKLNSTEQ